MRVVLIVVLSLLLISISLAKQEVFEMGPYNVSFDLNATGKYQLKDGNITCSETYEGAKYNTYTKMLSDSNNFVVIVIVYFANKMDKSTNHMQNEVNDYLMRSGYNLKDTNYRVFGAKNVFFGIGENFDRDRMFVAEYWLTHPYKGDSNVLIVSTYPWEGETLSLLKTIDVKRIS